MGLGTILHHATAHPIGILSWVPWVMATAILLYGAGAWLFSDLETERLVSGLVWGVIAPTVLGILCYLYYRITRRRHLRLYRSGEAVVGHVVRVDVVIRGKPWWRSPWLLGDHRGWLHWSEEQGRYGVRYAYRVNGRVYQGEDTLETRFGNRELCRVPAPRKGDRLTVLHEPGRPQRSVMALAIGAGLVDP
jgi:hypothetical protein